MGATDPFPTFAQAKGDHSQCAGPSRRSMTATMVRIGLQQGTRRAKRTACPFDLPQPVHYRIEAKGARRYHRS
jgi:hypothetical protein